MRAISLPNVDLPTMREAGEVARGAGQKGAASLRRWRSQAMDRSEPRRRMRPWIASGVFTIALIGAVFALLTWSRRPATESAGAETPTEATRSSGGLDPDDGFEDGLP